ncbi:MAG: tetratricopeptide repeat protein [bacterium]|nr:tetratricopeptide repeat protein [bacterium]
MLNRQLFAEAKAAYDARDYAGALRSYYICLKEQDGPFEPGEAGLIYHMLGNCLVKMKSFDDAAKAYQKALLDTDYENITAVHSNYGLALMHQEQYREAIEQFEAVLKDPTYETPFKAYNGLGNAYMKLGDFAAAGTAYRNAAVDERNPAPVKALQNLGVCFMGLGRPQDAINTYNAIFDFNPDQATLNKTYSNIGQAYVAAEQMPEAVEAFEKALEDPTFVLSDSAKADFEKARSWKPDFDDSGLFMSSDTLVEDYGMVQVPLPEQIDQVQPFQAIEPVAPMEIDPTATYGAGIPDADATGFFEAQEGSEQGFDMEVGKPKKHRGLRAILIIFVILLLIVIAAGVLFWRGFGYPTQSQVVQDLFTAHAAGEDVSQYWVPATNEEEEQVIAKIMNSVAETDDVSIDYVEKSMLESTVIVTATLDGGGTMRYEISMQRDFSTILGSVGWKINGIEYAFPSTQNSMSTSTMTSSDGMTDDSTAETNDSDVNGKTEAPAEGDAAAEGGDAAAGDSNSQQ